MCLLILSVSCGDNDRRPADILSEKELIRVMADLYVTEEKVNRLGLRRDSAEQVFHLLHEKTLVTAGIPDSVFRKSMQYYMARPGEMDKIYTALVDTLQLREQRTPRQ